MKSVIPDGLDVVQFITSQKGTPLLLDSAGYLYHKHQHSRKFPSKVYWKCVNYPKLKCTARATTDGAHIINFTAKHNHGVAEAKSSYKKLQLKMDHTPS